MKSCRLFFLWFFVSISIISCNKETINLPNQTDPIFMVNGTIGTQTFSLYAGKNGAYMHTFSENLNGVVQHCGFLKNDNNYFLVRISQRNVDIPSFSKFLERDSYEVTDWENNSSLMVLSKDLFENSASISTVSWAIDDIMQAGETIEITQPGVYTITAFITFYDNEQISITNKLVLGYKKNATFQFNPTDSAENLLIHLENNAALPFSSIQWYINDQPHSTNETLVYVGTNSKLKVKAKVIYSNGAEGIREIYIDRNNNEKNIEDFLNNSELPSIFWDEKAHFYVEIDGEQYTTLQLPSLTHLLTIHEISDYNLNELGNPVKKIAGSIHVPFRHEASGDTIQGDFEFVIGIEG